MNAYVREITQRNYNVKELAKMSKRTKENICDLLRAGVIKGTKYGKEWRISEEEAYKFLGLKTDLKSMEQELKIRELEGEVRALKAKLDSFKVLATTLNNLIEEN